jgi:hypothetical protein
MFGLIASPVHLQGKLTALHLAVENEDIGMVKELIRHRSQTQT